MFCETAYEAYEIYELWDEDYWPDPPKVDAPLPTLKTLTSQINNAPQVTRKSMFSHSGYLPVRVRDRRK